MLTRTSTSERPVTGTTLYPDHIAIDQKRPRWSDAKRLPLGLSPAGFCRVVRLATSPVVFIPRGSRSRTGFWRLRWSVGNGCSRNQSDNSPLYSMSFSGNLIDRWKAANRLSRVTSLSATVIGSATPRGKKSSTSFTLSPDPVKR